MTRSMKALLLGAAAVPSLASALPQRWSTGYNQGVLEYSVGGFGAADSNLILSCKGGRLDIATAIGGATPYPNSMVGFTIDGTRHAFRVGKDGWARIDNAPAKPDVERFWQGLRRGRTVKVAYADGRTVTLPLTGAGKTLTAAVCAP